MCICCNNFKIKMQLNADLIVFVVVFYSTLGHNDIITSSIIMKRHKMNLLYLLFHLLTQTVFSQVPCSSTKRQNLMTRVPPSWW